MTQGLTMISCPMLDDYMYLSLPPQSFETYQNLLRVRRSRELLLGQQNVGSICGPWNSYSLPGCNQVLRSLKSWQSSGSNSWLFRMMTQEIRIKHIWLRGPQIACRCNTNDHNLWLAVALYALPILPVSNRIESGNCLNHGPNYHKSENTVGSSKHFDLFSVSARAPVIPKLLLATGICNKIALEMAWGCNFGKSMFQLLLQPSGLCSCSCPLGWIGESC